MLKKHRFNLTIRLDVEIRQNWTWNHDFLNSQSLRTNVRGSVLQPGSSCELVKLTRVVGILDKRQGNPLSPLVVWSIHAVHLEAKYTHYV